MKKLLSLGIAVIGSVAIFAASGTAAAKDYQYCSRGVTSYMLQCGFDTLARCQDMSSGRGDDCLRNPALSSAAAAYAYAPGVGKTFVYAPYRPK
jgi:Protein of unknown function (DUF3551)